MVEQDKLSKHLLELISESLGLRPSYLNDLFGEEYQQTFLVNHYPPCSEPTPVEGIQKHSDFSALTILMQDVEGLQFRKDGQWVSLECIPSAYAINLGDQIEVHGCSQDHFFHGYSALMPNPNLLEISLCYLLWETLNFLKFLLLAADFDEWIIQIAGASGVVELQGAVLHICVFQSPGRHTNSPHP